ncbi:HDOD domain-containing protein [Colwellia psychrerythraea]|uniref:Putative signal transduction protein n=1 Tax=Colwellia psychrerythraea TaxID=28229 RepID=A0A099KMM7_COLPS|nr:HDOD domain-containing protein [Colwellia psychrerythraea]KGJ91147.1 putative signal transduction protein [Colwellia psychrerythraea]
MTADDYVEQASEIFVLSDSFIRIRELIDDEASTIDDISEVILLDPALAGTVLKLANSPFFNYPGKIDTISKAVLVLGITEVYNLVIAYFTTEAFKKINANQAYLDDFWIKSIDCALLMKFLGTSLGIVHAERLFILGLLHNLGELVVHQLTLEKHTACESNDINLLPWHKQQDILGFTFGECSAGLLKEWQLPYNIFAAIRDQDIDDLSQYNVETQLLYIAKRVMSKNQVFKGQSLDYSSLVTKEQLELLCLDKNMLENAVDYCDLERLSLLAILNPRASMLY